MAVLFKTFRASYCYVNIMFYTFSNFHEVDEANQAELRQTKKNREFIIVISFLFCDTGYQISRSVGTVWRHIPPEAG